MTTCLRWLDGFDHPIAHWLWGRLFDVSLRFHRGNDVRWEPTPYEIQTIVASEFQDCA